MKARTGLRLAQCGLIAVAIAAWGYCALTWFSGWSYQQGQERLFDRERKAENSGRSLHANPAVKAVPKDGSVIGRLEIPRIGVSVMVVEGVGRVELDHAAGHIPGTALPGESGNVGIAGHRDTFFRPLAVIHQGDSLSIATTGGVNQYRVLSTEVVRPENVSVLYPAGRDLLTLVTCYPFHYIGAAPKRFIVHAVRLPTLPG